MQGSDKRGAARPGVSRWAGTVSLIAIMAALPSIAAAQTSDPAPADDEEIVVTGIRAGLQNSVDTKRNQTSIVEVVSAEDIGKLPDVSIAESLARLPGLAGQRVNGRAQVISIRGLAPDFTTTLLNGRQQASSGDNRAVEFDQYPSELLSSVVVYKTPDATISGFGLSGTADLRTVRPLEFGRRAVAFNVRGETTDTDQLNDDVDTWGNRVSISYIDQFLNDTLGIAVGYAHLDSPSQNRHFKAYGYESFGGVSPGAVTPDSADNALQLNGQEAFAYSRENIRDAVIGIVEWAPTQNFRTTLDLYYSTFSQEETMRGAQWFSNSWADNATFTDVQTQQYGGTDFGASGTFNNAVPIIRNDFNTRDDELFAAGLNAEYNLTDTISIIGDLSYSKNERDEMVIETYAGYGLGTGGVTGATPDVGRTFDSYGFDIPIEGYPTYDFGLNYADATQVSLGDRAPWGGWAHDGAIRFPHVEETITAGDIAVRFDFDGPISQVDVGVNLTNRDKSKFVDDNDLFLANGRQQVLVAPEYLVSPTDIDFVGLGPVLSYNVPAVIDAYYTSAPILDANFYDKAWDIEETVTTFYARASLDEGPWSGNFGLQVVQQEQESTGSVIQGSPIVPIIVTEGADYTDVLPSINLSYELMEGHRVRFGMARVMARPRMDEMRANVTPGFGVPMDGAPPVAGTVLNPWTGSGGNPNLEPWRADAFDLSYEWYIDRTSYISVAYFYKDLESYVFNQALPFDFTGIPIPAASQARVDELLAAGVVLSPIGTMVRPANGEGGVIRGVEVSGALDFGLLYDPLEGLGLIASYSRSTSSLNPVGCVEFDPDNCPANPAPVRIPGLSGEVYNLTGYYERGGFQARASYRYRSAFKGEVVQLFATRGATEILEDEQVDAQIGYTFQDGSPLEGLGILLQVNNLTNSPYRTRLGLDTGGTTTADGTVLQETYEEYGRQILLGLNYRF